MENNKNIGVLTEQGFVAGMGLGFNPIKEELNPKKKPEDKDSQKNTSNKDKK